MSNSQETSVEQPMMKSFMFFSCSSAVDVLPTRHFKPMNRFGHVFSNCFSDFLRISVAESSHLLPFWTFSSDDLSGPGLHEIEDAPGHEGHGAPHPARRRRGRRLPIRAERTAEREEQGELRHLFGEMNGRST